MPLMRSIVLLSTALCWSGASAQLAVPASGGDATGIGGAMSWTLGQIDATATSSASGTVSQGVQQPFEFLILSASEAVATPTVIGVVPNPTNDGISLQFGSAPDAFTTYRVLDAHGQVVVAGRLSGANMYIPMIGWPSATYFIHIQPTDTDATVLRVIKH